MACGGRPMMITKNEYKSAKLAYKNYSEYVKDTEKKLSRLNIEVKRLGKIISEYENHIRGLEKQISDYENRCSAKGADDANDNA